MKKPPESTSRAKPPGQRQKKVAEEIRQILSRIMARGDFCGSELQQFNITLTHVSVSPDLRNALIYFMPLGGKYQEEALSALKNCRQELRYLLAKELTLRHVPELKFALDTTIEENEKIQKLFASLKPSNP